MADRLDPTFLLALIANLRVTYPAIAEDEDQWLLAVESQTEAPEFLAAVEDRMSDTDSKIEANGNRIAKLKSRCDRLEQRSDALRGLMFKVMMQAGLRKLELAAATLSIRAGQPRVIITDEARLPEQFVRIKREPDKHLIASHLKAGETVPGAEISNSEPVLSVRVK